MRRTALSCLLVLQLGVAGAAAAAPTLGPVHRVTGDEPFCQNRPLLAPLRSGGFAVAWNDFTWPSQVVRLRLADGTGRLLDSGTVIANRQLAALVELTGLAVLDGQPLGPQVDIDSATEIAGATATADGCGWIVGWSAFDDSRFQARARRFEGGCPQRPGLSLGGGRFRAEVVWRTPDGGSGLGQARPLVDDTGAFWFFWPDNLELMVKVLDGRGLNNAFWVFYATLTDVAFDLTVTDLETGEKKVYSKPQGRMESRADVNAFPQPGPPPPAASSRRQASQAQASATGCAGTDTELCLAGSRFRAGVRFVHPGDGVERDAVAVPLTSESGAFWFFAPDNLELMLKIVDGRNLNGRFWVFYGGLSDVDYEITVTDTETGAEQVYTNPRGRIESRADTEAFP